MRSRDQILVGKPLARGAKREAIHPVQGVTLHVALTQPESEFVGVAAKVVRADMVLDADQAALEHRENALDAVGGHAIADEFLGRMVHRVVREEHAIQATVDG